MTFIDFNERAAIVHKNNEKWWVDLNTLERIDRNKGEMLMLVLTELAEAAEGIRKNLKDDHLPHRPMAEVELADAEIRLLDFAGGFGFVIDSNLVNSIYEEDIEDVFEKYEIPRNQLEGLLDVATPVIFLKEELKGNMVLGTSIEDLLTACIFCIRAFAYLHGYDIEGSYHEKLEYNKTRKDHSIEERRKEGGKKV